jgi:hypothetical protein
MGDLVTINRPNRTPPQGGKGREQILPLELAAGAEEQLEGTLGQQIAATLGMERREKGRPFERGVEEFLLLLDEVAPADPLGEHAQHAQANELPVGDLGAVDAGAGVVVQNGQERMEELVGKAGVALEIGWSGKGP